jgi:hypothetical protein
METLYTNLIVSLAQPIIEAYRAGDIAKAQELLHNKIAEHNSPTLAIELTRYVWHMLNRSY